MMKLTSGMLCKDMSSTERYTTIVFYCTGQEGWWHLHRAWTPAAWKLIYSLKPPKPGKCFEVEIEL